MAIKIVQNVNGHNYDLKGIEIDRIRKTGVLIRQSKKKADENNYESRLRQESLVSVAMEIRGDSGDSNIILYDEGAGVSGAKGYDQRPKLSKMYQDIANDVIGSLIVARADRLFRDQHFRNVSMFTELAEEKKIKIIVPGKTMYDFTKTKDLQAFQIDMQEAARYLSGQVAYMHETLAQKIKRGLYGGGILPAPYVIDRRVPNDEQIPIIYEHWKKIAVDLYKRFIELDFSLARIADYIFSQPYIFPYMLAEDAQKYHFPTRMTQVPGGYTFSSLAGIEYFFSNLTLGGYAKIGRDEKGDILLKENAFEAAIPKELLWPCYGAIKGENPDGIPFEQQKISRRIKKKTPESESKAILHGYLGSDEGRTYLNHSGGQEVYMCYVKPKREGLKLAVLWSLPSIVLDQIVLNRLTRLSEVDVSMAGRIKSFYDNNKTDDVNPITVTERQILKASAQINRLDSLLTNPAKPLSAQTEARYIEQLIATEKELTRLQKKLDELNETMEDPETVIPNFYYIISHLSSEFGKLSSEVQKKLIRKVIKTVKLDMISSHIFKLYIEWGNGIALHPDMALIWRGLASNFVPAWTNEQDELLRAMYPEHSQLDLLKAFPRKSFSSIYTRAYELGIPRNVPRSGPNSGNRYHHSITYNDLEAISNLVESAEEKERFGQIIADLASKTLRGNFTEYWLLPLNVISFEGLPTDEAIPCGDSVIFERRRRSD
ncbi:MAG TPA: recombinase family protein [Ktedonosporobacter sp.]|nr:recombinase family protein [Ktedonosporobacter sp.]